ncbi:MAG: Rv0909 family putative TA system antitoxin [Ilumatobacteraceae bacterium]
MGILDKIKNLLSGRQDQVKSGIDKASGAVESKIGAKHASKVDQVAEKAKDVVDKLAGDTPSTSSTADVPSATAGDVPPTFAPKDPPATAADVPPTMEADIPPTSAPKDPPATGV